MRIGRFGIGVAVAVGLAGCATSSNSTTTAVATAGGDLSIYASVPSQQSDMFEGEELALKQGTLSGKFRLLLKPLTATTPKQVTDNARTADNDKSTIAYIGESTPGYSDLSVPITNELGILQVSPADDAVELTDGSPVLPESRKSLFYPSESSFGYTFAAVVPSAAKEALALVAEMQALKVTKLYVTSQPLPCTDADVSGCYGKAFAHLVSTDAAAKSITVQQTASGADGAFVGTNDPAYAASTFDNLASSDPGVKLFGGPALDTPAFASALGSAAQGNTYISSAGLLKLPASFTTPFKAAYGHPPSSQALFGYLAVSAVIDAIRQADGSGNSRNAVINDFFGHTRQSPIGSFTITQSGDVNLPGPTIVINRFHDGQLQPFKSAPPLG
jgi:branched-chain amino acid transport system substrate-binding protein